VTELKAGIQNLKVCLIVDDEPAIRKTLAITMEGEGWTVRACANVEAALQAAAGETLALAFVDLRLGTASGLDLLPQLLKLQPGLPVVMITAFASVNTAVEAMRRGAADYLPKPFVPMDVRQAARQAVALRAVERRSLETQAGALLESKSPAMQSVLAMAQRAAASDSSLLLAGETGTGKGVLARAVHAWSQRAGKPFAVVACPSLPTELLESELFGHAQGAFTGAYREQAGRVAQAEGGTLFLDEIGDLPLAVQAKLLRFLQDKQYERLGESQTRSADLRVIAATHVDLQKAAEAGRFRQDLYYRLGVLVLTLPALRERLEDLPALAQVMLGELAVQLKRPGLTLAPACLPLLTAHAWPGNLRELRNVLERAAVLAPSDDLQPQDLSLSPASTAPASSEALLSLERMEEIHIKRVLGLAPTLDQAARILGVDSATLWRKRKKYGL
jgi:NtrC-family two-component system response regulator AlgB